MLIGETQAVKALPQEDPQHGSYSWHRGRLLIPCLAGTVALLVYIATLAPSVTSEDSGELIAAAHCFGVPHPPGYPLWTILCGTFIRLLPWGEVAWRCNQFSALASAAAVAILCRVMLLAGLRWPAALGAGLAYAFGQALWSQSVITEVYTLHMLVFSLILWCVLRWQKTRQGRYLGFASLLTGLGMCNHQTIGYTALAAAIWVLVQSPRLALRWRLVLASILCFAMGFIPYAYLYLRGRADPPLNWGHATTLRGVWEHASRKQYRTSTPNQHLPHHSDIRERWEQVKVVGRYCVNEHTPVLMALSLTGAILAVRHSGRRRFLMLLALVALCNVTVHLVLVGLNPQNRIDVWCNRVFLLPVYSCIAMVAGLAAHALLDWPNTGSTRQPARIAGWLVSATLAVVPAVANYHPNNMRHYWYAYDHARNILDTMLPGALILPSGDHNTFPLIYLVHVLGHRPDVIIADKYGYIDLALYRDMPNNPGKPRTMEERNLIEEWIIRHAKRPVYYTAKKPVLVPNASLVQVGLLYHLLPASKSIERDSVWNHIRYRNLEGQPAPRDLGADNILADYAFFQGLRALSRGQRDDALQHFGHAAALSEGIREMFNNIGSALAEHGLEDESMEYYLRAARMDPAYEAPRWNLGRMFKHRQEFDDAEKVFMELSQANPEDFRVWGELGFLAARTPDRAELAVSYWHRSIKLNPAQPQILEQLHLYYASGAHQELHGAQEGFPEDPTAPDGPPTTTMPASGAPPFISDPASVRRSGP